MVGSGWLGSRAVINEGDLPRELSELVVPLVGSLEATGDLFLPYRLVDGDGVVSREDLELMLRQLAGTSLRCPQAAQHAQVFRAEMDDVMPASH